MASREYTLKRNPQNAEVGFMLHHKDFMRRLAQARSDIRPSQMYKYVDGRLIHIETEMKVLAGMTAVALQAEVGISFI